MDVLEFLSSVNKISFIAFLAAFAFLIYEIRLIRGDKKTNLKPEIPQFDQSATPLPITQELIAIEEARAKPVSSIHKYLLPVLIIMVIFFGLISVYGLIRGSNKDTEQQQAQVQVQEVKSVGIKIYDTQWQEIAGESTSQIKVGDKIYIGIASVKGTDIDKARIKVNEPQWGVDQITAQYNKEKNVFYREYTVKESDTNLQIEAQLHSKANGWLTE